MINLMYIEEQKNSFNSIFIFLSIHTRHLEIQTPTSDTHHPPNTLCTLMHLDVSTPHSTKQDDYCSYCICHEILSMNPNHVSQIHDVPLFQKRLLINSVWSVHYTLWFDHIDTHILCQFLIFWFFTEKGKKQITWDYLFL